MSHQIAEAIIENGKLTYIDKQIPDKKIKVHIIYDLEDIQPQRDMGKALKETAGIYNDINAAAESIGLRENWDRDFGN